MEPHMHFSGSIPSMGGNESMYNQQALQMQDLKCSEHLKKLDEKWTIMKKEFDVMPKGTPN